MSEEHTLVDIMAIARKRWVWVAAPIAALVVLANWYTGGQSPRYEAAARVVLSEDASTRALDPGSQNPVFLTREIENQIALAYGSEIEALVVAELGTLPELTVTHNPESDILLFLAEWPTAEGAARAANTWAEIFVTVRQERELASIAQAMEGLEVRLATLQIERDSIWAPLDALRRRIRAATDPADALRLQQDYDLLADSLRYELDLNGSEAQTTVADLARLRLQSELASAEQNLIAEPAEVPDDPANTPLSRILVIAVIAGGVIGLALAVLTDSRDKLIRTPSDLQELTDLPLLAAVPKAKRAQRPSIGLATVEDPKGAQADTFHQIRSALEFEMQLEPLHSVIVTSPVAGDGRSTVAANLALALGSVGTHTALVDSDFRAGSLHRIFNIEREPGLSDLVRREIKASQVARSVPDDESDGLVVIPSGTVPSNPAAFVASPQFLRTLRWMGTQADMVVVDTPPLLGVPETHTLGRQVDGVILVIRAKRTTEDELRDALAVLEQVRSRVIGVVLLGVPRARRTLRQYARARQRAARDRPPVLNVSEGPRTADYQSDEAAQASALASDTNAVPQQDPPLMADLEAGQAPDVEAEQTPDVEAGQAPDVEAGQAPDVEAGQPADIAENGVDQPEGEFDSPNNGFVILTDVDDSSDAAVTASDGVETATDEPAETTSLNGRADETDEDWFQDRAPIASNGDSTPGNGNGQSGIDITVDTDVSEMIDIVEPTDELDDSTTVELDDSTEIESDDSTTVEFDDATDIDETETELVNEQSDDNNASRDGNGSSDLDGESQLIDLVDSSNGFDDEIVDLAELDDGLVE